MTKNPLINALGAILYIFLVVLAMTFFTAPLRNKPDTFFAPIAFLSVFTLSAAVMGYVILYQPVTYLISGKKKEAVRLFLQTLGVFGVVTVVILTLLFSGIL